MQAVIKTGGKQYLVTPGQTLDVELVTSDKKLELDALLVVENGTVQIGRPIVDGVKVVAEVLGETKGEKIRVLKFKAKKRVKKLTGHRQHYSQIKIISIGKNQPKPEVAKQSSAKAPSVKAKTS